MSIRYKERLWRKRGRQAISSTHGIRGEVKVFPTTDDPARFKLLKKVTLDTGREQIPLEIQGVKFFKQFVIVKFKGIDNINDIEKYKGKSLLVNREDAVALEEDEYYIADIIGMQVNTEDGTTFGVLKDVMETGANDVYIVETEDGKKFCFRQSKSAFWMWMWKQ